MPMRKLARLKPFPTFDRVPPVRGNSKFVYSALSFFFHSCQHLRAYLLRCLQTKFPAAQPADLNSSKLIFSQLISKWVLVCRLPYATRRTYEGMSNFHFTLWYFYRFIEEYSKAQVKIWAITTTNEPINGIVPFAPFNSLGWLPSQMVCKLKFI